LLSLRLFFSRATQRVSAVFAVERWLAGWLAGWLDVCHTPVLCLNGEINLKTFSTTGSPVVPVCSQPCADTQFQGESLQSGLVAFYDIRPGNRSGSILTTPERAHGPNRPYTHLRDMHWRGIFTSAG